MITLKHNYDDGYIGLVDLKIKGLPVNINIEGESLILKSEFHISLLCVKRIALMINEVGGQAIEEGLVSDFLNYTLEHPLDSYEVSTEFRLVVRDQRKTIVVMVHVPGLNEFFEILSEKYQIILPPQPAHITLYTLQPEVAIGILSNEQLESDSNIVVIPELDLLKKSPDTF